MRKTLASVIFVSFFLAAITKLSAFPIYDPFDYAPGQHLWGQTDPNGDYWWEIDSGQTSPPNAIVATSVPVTYPGLPAGAGNSIILTNINGGQGARMFVNTNNTLDFFGNGATGAPYPGPMDVLASMVVNITNMASLSSSPVYCFGYNDQGTVATQGSNPGTMVYRIYFKSVNGTGTNYQIGISKQGGQIDFATNILQTYQNVFIVMDETITNCGVGEPNNCQSDIATLWVDPPSDSFGEFMAPTNSAQEAASVENNLTPYTSCFMFENRANNTPNALLIGQFRFGTNWSWVTGGPSVVNNNPGASNIYGASFNLEVAGLNNGSPNTYQWLLNGTNLANGPSASGSGATVSGVNTTNLLLSGTVGTDSGSYSIVVSNSVGSYTTIVSSVTVFQPEPPTITAEPETTTVPLYPGGSDIISFTTQGSPPITYYWYSNSQVVAVTTNLSSFTISNVAANATVYSVASNVFGTNVTSPVSIEVQALPTAPYTLAVLNDKPIDFWPLNEHPDNGAGNTDTPAIDYVGGNDGFYTNVILGLDGYATGLAEELGYSPATDTETAAEFGYYPSFPATNSLVGGIQNITFTAVQDSPSFSLEAWVNIEGNTFGQGAIIAKGWGVSTVGGDQFSLEYETNNWQFYVRDASGIGTSVTAPAATDTNWHHLVAVADIPIATLYLYVDGNLVSSNGGYPTTGVGTNTIGVENILEPVTIGSAGTNATSAFVKNWEGEINDVAIYKYALTANQVSNHYVAAGIPPEIVVQPLSSTNISAGGALIATVVVEGSGPLSYQWFDLVASSAIPGQTNATLVVSNVANSDAYDVVVSSRFGTNTSQSVSLNVIYAPQITQNITPSTDNAVVGSTASFSVGVEGAPPLAYFWQFNNGTTTVTLTNNDRISGANSNILKISDVQLSDTGTYQLSVTNADGGPVNSDQATLSVAPTLGFFDDSGNGYSVQASPAGALVWQDGGVYLTSSIGSEAAAVFYQSPVYIGAFEAAFDYQLSSGSNSAAADGVTFCIQNDPRGAAAVGSDGGQLAVGSPSAITPSVELEFNIYEGDTVGGVGISVETNGAIGTVHSTGSVNINSGDIIAINLAYFNAVLTINLDDTLTGSQFTLTTNVNIPAKVGGNTAYVGFTGSDGGDKATQLISNFSFISVPSLTFQTTNGQPTISWTSSVGDYVLQETPSLLPTNWVTVPTVPTATNDENQVTVAPGGTSEFYRLSLQ
ncbi:MAG TPA: immunoglobulin domain-containing protein [Verrucomicrobiae bacterium]|jgi:hypothetical protein|nr:immunoglobulin domain-containing protein [Verrucomicrobiae bacterium]